MSLICVVTGSRSEYGLLRWLMKGISQSTKLKLQVIATGSHLSPEFGNTKAIIEEDGFQLASKVEMLLSSDTAVGVTKSVGLGVIGFADALFSLKPDLVVVLGDRYEILAAAVAATIARIPIAHLHGGEKTEGAYDDVIRHSITKMSHLHFVAAEEYRERVVQLGEDPRYIYNVGGLGVDCIKRIKFLKKQHLEKLLKFNFQRRNLLITFHPVTLEPELSLNHFKEILAALTPLKNTGLLFTIPNADNESRELIRTAQKFCAHRSNATLIKSLSQQQYLSCLRFSDGILGNSSSGIIEAPSLRKGTVNIGTRQDGRLRATSVIDCVPDRKAIARSISELYSPVFRKKLEETINPYGEGGASEKIVGIIEEQINTLTIKKKFIDLDPPVKRRKNNC